MASRLFIVAAEPSGDLLARETVEALRRIEPDIELAAIGGPELEAVGLASPIDIGPLSILGFLEGLMAYGTVVQLADQAADEIVGFNPDAVVLVDSWGFMLRVAQRLRKRAPHIKRIKLVGPQVWATRPGRAKTLAAEVDGLICIHEMEVPYYEPHGLPVTVMGPPALSRTEKGDGTAFRTRLGIDPSQTLLLVLPGSRPSEISRTAPALVEAADRVRRAHPGTEVIFAPAGPVRAQFETRFADALQWGRLAPQDSRSADVLAAADLALACSGTVTTELAAQGTPFIVGYKTGWITWMLARYLLFKPTHITLLNIACDDTEVVPEFVQTQLQPELVAKRALSLLTTPGALDRQVREQNAALSRMKVSDRPAAEVAADAILSLTSAGR